MNIKSRRIPSCINHWRPKEAPSQKTGFKSTRTTLGNTPSCVHINCVKSSSDTGGCSRKSSGLSMMLVSIYSLVQFTVSSLMLFLTWNTKVRSVQCLISQEMAVKRFLTPLQSCGTVQKKTMLFYYLWHVWIQTTCSHWKGFKSCVGNTLHSLNLLSKCFLDKGLSVKFCQITLKIWQFSLF